MADFQFRTRGQQSPQGKQRVYFTCHPDDFEKCFEEIQKETLGRQDCAVFYLEPETHPEDVEDYELRLREMLLFVVPVTKRLQHVGVTESTKDDYLASTKIILKTGSVFCPNIILSKS